MIRINVFPATATNPTRRMYENRAAVGIAKVGETANLDKASNQLVKFFLRAFFRRRPELLRSLPGGGRFQLNGPIDSQTVQGIGLFQAAVRATGFPLVAPDKRVSVATDSVFISGTQLRWTIHALNSFYALKSGETDFDTLSKNVDIRKDAPELAKELDDEETRLALLN